MSWEGVWHALSSLFDELIRGVIDSYPTIDAGQPRQLGGWGRMTFYHYVSFSYDFANCEHEDLVLYFACIPVKNFWHENGSPWFPGVENREAVGFEIERGNGERLAMLDPVLLPEDENSAEYEAVVMDYVAQTEAFIEEHMPLILDALRKPFEPQLGDRA